MPVTAMELVAAARQKITVENAKDKLTSMAVIDVIEAAEFSAGHLPGAFNIPRGVLEFKINTHPELHSKQDKDTIVYCQCGGRSALSTDALNQLDYSKAVSMAGGFKAWSDCGFDIV